MIFLDTWQFLSDIKIYVILVYLFLTFSIKFLIFSELLAADVSKNKNSWISGVLPIEYG